MLGSQIWVSTCVLFCLRLFLSLSFRLRFVAWENMGFDHFLLFISLPSIFPSFFLVSTTFFSYLHQEALLFLRYCFFPLALLFGNTRMGCCVVF